MSQLIDSVLCTFVGWSYQHEQKYTSICIAHKMCDTSNVLVRSLVI